MEQYDIRVDDYIERSAEFAKPILEHLRQLVHKASPLLSETIKWSAPFFDYKGPVCHMVAFKQHCAFGFWKESLLGDPGGILKKGDQARGSLGRITSIADLPDDDILIHFIQQAIILNETGDKPAAKKKPVPKVEIAMPNDFAELLDQHTVAKENYGSFSPSHKREYLEWIVDAKTDATRHKRMQIAIEQIVEGKSRHWKYH